MLGSIQEEDALQQRAVLVCRQPTLAQDAVAAGLEEVRCGTETQGALAAWRVLRPRAHTYIHVGAVGAHKYNEGRSCIRIC